jgi:hypothetical protein
MNYDVNMFHSSLQLLSQLFPFDKLVTRSLREACSAPAMRASIYFKFFLVLVSYVLVRTQTIKHESVQFHLLLCYFVVQKIRNRVSIPKGLQVTER